MTVYLDNTSYMCVTRREHGMQPREGVWWREREGREVATVISCLSLVQMNSNNIPSFLPALPPCPLATFRLYYFLFSSLLSLLFNRDLKLLLICPQHLPQCRRLSSLVPWLADESTQCWAGLGKQLLSFLLQESLSLCDNTCVPLDKQQQQQRIPQRCVSWLSPKDYVDWQRDRSEGTISGGGGETAYVGEFLHCHVTYPWLFRHQRHNAIQNNRVEMCSVNPLLLPPRQQDYNI